MIGECTNICHRTAYVPTFIKNRAESENLFLEVMGLLDISVHFKGKWQKNSMGYLSA
jgi:hypothetical protein